MLECARARARACVCVCVVWSGRKLADSLLALRDCSKLVKPEALEPTRERRRAENALAAAVAAPRRKKAFS